MFDFEYNENVGFVPYISVMKSETEGVASEEDLEKTNENVETVSGAVVENKEAIAVESAAREAADEEIVQKIDDIPTFELTVVDVLPSEGVSGTIYLVKDEGKDTYSEYVYVNGQWEKLGTDIDLADYVSKTEFDETVANLAVKSDVETALEEKADTDSVYTKTEADAKFLTEHQDISNLATKGELAEKANSSDVYTKSEADDKFLTEHQDISGLATKVEVEEGLAGKADADSVYTKEEADDKFLTEHQDISDLATKEEVESGVSVAISAVAAVETGLAGEISAREQAIAGLHEEIVALPKFKIVIITELPTSGDNATIYLLKTGDETGNLYTEYVYVNGGWEEIGTQELDLSGYAKVEDVNAISGVVETLTYEFDSVDEKLAGLAEVNVLQDEAINEIKSGLTELAEVKVDRAELDAAIAGKEAEIYNLTKIVGDLGGAVTYELPGENGKSFNTLMGNNGTVKLTDDVTTGRFGPGITAKNNVKLNLNSHDLTVTGLTTSTAQGAIMARGTQVITIGGKGTIDAGEGICIEGNGADSVINLTGSTSVYRTNRSGGELVYCYAGTINITNGTFRNDGEDKKFVLNCYDANYRNGTAKIIVTGGKFYDFDPANNTAEGEGTSFVPEGYESVPSVVVEDEVEHTVYTVKKSA